MIPVTPRIAIDEDAIERFGRDLDDADLAARAFSEDRGDAQDDDEDEDEDMAAATDTAASAVSAAPY